MSEWRRDPASGRWVLIAPERARRPGAPGLAGADARVEPPSARYDPDCPFCPGNEAELAGILEALPDDGAPGWRTRVVPNRFPALCPEAPPPEAAEGGLVARALGHHEVIVETPRHDLDLRVLPERQVEAVLETCRRRQRVLLARPGIRSVLPFRNHGRQAGASLAHPHSQIVASALPLPRQAAVEAWARARHAETGRCPTCAALEHELHDGRRIVEATPGFVALVPFAAAAPCELQLLPRRHRACFAEAADGELAELAGLLRRTLARLAAALDDPPYNYAIDSAAPGEAGSPWIHWRLRLLPDLVRPGGFELGAGLPINPSSPEADAARLRGTVAPAPQEEP